jgi:Flp pilus assembly pilin Flp
MSTQSKGDAEMKTLLAQIGRFAADDTGATATEYGILATAIGLAIVQVVDQNGTQLGGLLERLAADMSGR